LRKREERLYVSEWAQSTLLSGWPSRRVKGSADHYDTRDQICKYEKQIAQMVYKLYGLTEKEIAIVEGENE